MTHSLDLIMRRYSIEPRTGKYVKEHGLLSFAKKKQKKRIKKILNTGLDSLKTASKKVVDKTGEILGNKIADAVTGSNDNKMEKQEPVEEIVIPPEERDEMLNKLSQVLLQK